MKKIIPFLMCMLFALWACEKDTPTPPASVDSMQFEGVPSLIDEGAGISLSQYLIITPEAVGDTVTVEWSSSDKEIATVSASGSVEALRAGDVTITAKAMDKTAQVKLTIDKVKIKEFTIPATLEVYVGEKIKFPINDLKPKNAPLYRFEWEADNDGKEPTYSEGKWYLKADKEREYTLTASVDDAEEAKCVVKFIKPLVDKLVFNPASYTIEEGGSLSLESNLQITPAKDIDANTIKVIWSSSKESVATIDQNGKVQSVAAGKTTITAKAGNKTATCTVEVTAKPGSEDPETPEDPEKPEDPSDPMDPSDPEIPVDPEKPTFTITFNANGGEGTMESITVNEGESVELSSNRFTKDVHTFIEWNTSADGRGSKYSDRATISPTFDIILYAQWKDNANGHEWIDLALPSGTKWASMNVGATTPEGYGYYFAWGETTESSYYHWTNYKHCDGSYKRQIKYCTESDYGTRDDKTLLELVDDAANANWGGTWRMPTTEDIAELIDNCYYEKVTQNGVDGFLFTSIKNKNSIFLPYTGYKTEDELMYAKSDGYYWSSNKGQTTMAKTLHFYIYNGTQALVGNNIRCSGNPIRAVLKK